MINPTYVIPYTVFETYLKLQCLVSQLLLIGMKQAYVVGAQIGHIGSVILPLTI